MVVKISPRLIKNITSLVLVPLALLSVGFLFLAYKFQLLPKTSNEPQNMAKPKKNQHEQLEETVTSPTLRSYLEHIGNKDFYANSDTKFYYKEIDGLWWVSEDNWSILIDNAESVGIVRNSAYTELKGVNSFTDLLVKDTASFIERSGFVKVENNSSRSLDDTNFYDYILGFRKGETVCLLTVNPDQRDIKIMSGYEPIPNIKISCFEGDFEKYYDEQIPFLKALNRRNVVVRIQKENDIAAEVAVNWRRTGAYALLSIVNGVWEVIYEGQNQPSCEKLREYDFPAEIHSVCY